MLRILTLGIALSVLAISTIPGEARARRHKPARVSVEVEMLRKLISDNEKIRSELAAINKRLRPDAVASAEPETVPVAPSENPALPKPMIPDLPAGTLKSYADHIAKSSKLVDLTPKLADKVAEILAACPGARMSSGYRPGARVRGSGRPSLHSHYPSKAADLAGNPGCIAKHLAGWPGGRSTDYAAVRHYHVSYAPNSREWGSRFAHYRGPYHLRRTRHATLEPRQVSVPVARHAVY